MKKSKGLRRGLAAILLFICVCITLTEPDMAFAQISGPDAFANVEWKLVHEEALQGDIGVVQSVCATEDYIIVIENTSDFSNAPDVVSAYYKNTTDAAGNPVEQFSRAKRVEDTDWEHGNGMAYNPNTHEIYVALYTSKSAETRGCLFVMNPDTLQLTRTIKVTDDYNILGIDYKQDTDQYVIQTNDEDGYSFKILDANFQLVEDLGQYAGTSEGDNFQDLIVCEDYIINFPLTLNQGIGNFLNVYSISQRSLLMDMPVTLATDGPVSEEPEGLCEIAPGEFVAADNMQFADGRRVFRFYQATVPYYFNVNVTAENGTAQQPEGQILRGESCTLNLAANKGYAVSQILVDGSPQQITPDMISYTLENVQGNHMVNVIFAPAPVVDEVKENIAQTVNDVRVESSINQIVANPGAGTENRFWTAKVIVLVVLLVFVVVLMIAFYIYMLHVRRVRARRRALARRRRRHAQLMQSLHDGFPPVVNP